MWCSLMTQVRAWNVLVQEACPTTSLPRPWEECALGGTQGQGSWETLGANWVPNCSTEIAQSSAEQWLQTRRETSICCCIPLRHCCDLLCRSCWLAHKATYIYAPPPPKKKLIIISVQIRLGSKHLTNIASYNSHNKSGRWGLFFLLYR